MRFIAKNKAKCFIFLFLLTIPLFLNTMNVHAFSDNDCWNVISNNRRFFSQNKIYKDFLRWVGWGIVKGLRWIANNSQALYLNTIGLLDFTSYSELEKFVKSLKYVFQGILALSIMWLGITLIVNHKKRPQLLTSLLLAALSISALSTLLITANGAVSAFCGEVAGESFSDSIINDNFYDLMYIDSKYGLETLSQDSKYLSKCHYPKDKFDIDNIDINARLNYENTLLSSKARTILSKQFDLPPTLDGKAIASKVYNGWGWNTGDSDDLFNEFYYRYHTNTFPIMISLIAIIIVYLCVSYKAMRLIYELAIKRILALLYSADITGTQKTIKIFASIKDSYIILMLTAVLLKVFQLAQAFLSKRFEGESFTYCILLLFTAFAVIDGPTIIQTLTGEDAGLQSGFGKMLAIYNAGKGVSRSASNMARSGIGAAMSRKRHNDLKDAMGGGANGKADKMAQDAKTNINGGSMGQESNKDITGAMNQAKKNDKDGAEKNLRGNSENPNSDIKDADISKDSAMPNNDIKDDINSKDNDNPNSNNMDDNSSKVTPNPNNDIINGNDSLDSASKNNDIKDADSSKASVNQNGNQENSDSKGMNNLENGEHMQGRDSNNDLGNISQENEASKNNSLNTFDPAKNDASKMSTNDDMKQALSGKKSINKPKDDVGKVNKNKPAIGKSELNNDTRQKGMPKSTDQSGPSSNMSNPTSNLSGDRTTSINSSSINSQISGKENLSTGSRNGSVPLNNKTNNVPKNESSQKELTNKEKKSMSPTGNNSASMSLSGKGNISRLNQPSPNKAHEDERRMESELNSKNNLR